MKALEVAKLPTRNSKFAILDGEVGAEAVNPPSKVNQNLPFES